jgi:hypothetical protein
MTGHRVLYFLGQFGAAHGAADWAKDCVHQSAAIAKPAAARLLILIEGSARGSPREPLHNSYQLMMRGAVRIADFGERVGIGKLAQAHQLADPLSPVQLQFGPAVGKQNPPELVLAKEMVEFGRRHIDQKHDQYPDLDRDKATPLEGRNHVRQEGAEWMVFDKREPDPVFEQARDKHDGPIENRLEEDRLDQRRAIVRRSSAMALATRTDFPTTSAAAVASMKLPKATE